MHGYLKTMAVSERLRVPYHRLIGLIRYGLITPPAKDSSQDYWWSESDIEAARTALEARRARRRKSGPSA